MFGEKIIKNKIKSIKNTQKITKAMEMISASKIRKSKIIKNSINPYYINLMNIINNVKSINLEYKNDYFEERKIKTIGYLIISTDRGLCGSLNTNLFKLIVQNIQKLNKKKINYQISLIGSKGLFFFKNLNINVINYIHNLGDHPKISDLSKITYKIIKLYKKQKIDKFIVISNKFINTMLQVPIKTQILPIIKEKENTEKNSNWNYIYEPNANTVLKYLVQRYIEIKIYNLIIDNIVSEQSARMMSMKMATDNGEKLIEELNLNYNKSRQYNITKEVSEIISGSSFL